MNPTPAPGRLRAKKVKPRIMWATSKAHTDWSVVFYDKPFPGLNEFICIPCDPESLAALAETVAHAIFFPREEDFASLPDHLKAESLPKARRALAALGLPESLPCKKDSAGRGKRK